MTWKILKINKNLKKKFFGASTKMVFLQAGLKGTAGRLLTLSGDKGLPRGCFWGVSFDKGHCKAKGTLF
jgi:hypothetical protein